MKPKGVRIPSPPKPRREKIPPPAPFVPTPEQVKQVEERYLELAQSGEFDGIRTQIARELSIPKKAIKKIVKDLRSRENIPSWWETQTYKGSAEELERIKTAYIPHLPVPPVGVHKLLAEQLDLKPGTIYQAIKTVRHELSLPQYNDPSLHTQELAEKARKRQTTNSEQSSERATEKTGEQVPVQIQHVTTEQSQQPEQTQQTVESAQPLVEG
jgi:hypothetical protein